MLLLFLLVSVQLSIPAAKTNHKNEKLNFNATYGWHDWTVNPDFNKIGNTPGAYWAARAWKWYLPTGPDDEGGPNDEAYFYKSGSDYRLYVKAATIDSSNVIHCAGATQGWVWDHDPPGNLTKDDIFQPTPLRITSAIGQLKSRTYLIDYNHYFLGTWGVLSNVWFKVYHVYDGYSGVFFDGVLGIDFYYDSGGQAIHDGSFRYGGTTMIYTKMPNPGAGWTTFDILQALIEAQQAAASNFLYFDISNCWLYQVEVLVEKGVPCWTTADYSYFRVYYFETGSLTGLQVSFHTSDSKNLKQTFVDIRKANNITYSIYKLDEKIATEGGFYKLKINVLNEEEVVIIDSIRLLAVETDSNNVTEIPVYLAFNQHAMKYINDLIVKNDGKLFKLTSEGYLELWFDSSKIPYENYQLYLLTAANII